MQSYKDLWIWQESKTANIKKILVSMEMKVNRLAPSLCI